MDYYTTGITPYPLPVQPLREEEVKSQKDSRNEKYTERVLISKKSS
jgi:hypothetical protein